MSTPQEKNLMSVAALELTSEETIKQAAFNRLDPELWNVLTDEDHIAEFHLAAKSLRTTLQAQLSDYKANVSNGYWREDTDWYGRTRALDARVIALLQELKRRLKDRDRRHLDRVIERRYQHLRHAIMAHREATRAGYEPTEEDHLLWTALDEAWSIET
jgi:hypothetical protein